MGSTIHTFSWSIFDALPDETEFLPAGVLVRGGGTLALHVGRRFDRLRTKNHLRFINIARLPNPRREGLQAGSEAVRAWDAGAVAREEMEGS